MYFSIVGLDDNGRAVERDSGKLVVSKHEGIDCMLLKMKKVRAGDVLTLLTDEAFEELQTKLLVDAICAGVN